MDFGALSEQDVFSEELRILDAAKSELAAGKPPERPQMEQLVKDYEKLLKTTMKLSRISDIQGRTLKEREQEVKLAKAELDNLEQLRRQLISDISHELRTPITSVQGYVKAFLDDVIQPDAAYLTMIYQKLLTINQLIADLFQLSTLKANRLPLHYKDVPLRQWYASLQGKHALEASRQGVELIVEPELHVEARGHLHPDEIVVHIDAIRIEQVVTNLLDNALKFTPAGGTIRIAGRLSRVAPKAATLFLPDIDRDADRFWFTLTVDDTGEGIDPEDMPYLFERFFRARRPQGEAEDSGAGLGLAISKEIIGRHGGQIGADSEPGHGSRFHFSLPAYDICGFLEDDPRR
ncbi:HAMP domain-containing sensor histidine kinase [Paenibacillus hodogayensis]|uniref:histidine kinase n=1 Tax=Paenibacillus hodogayensis TaxID=279208 RepID=A0ABV5VV66_9BACL